MQNWEIPDRRSPQKRINQSQRLKATITSSNGFVILQSLTKVNPSWLGHIAKEESVNSVHSAKLFTTWNTPGTLLVLGYGDKQGEEGDT